MPKEPDAIMTGEPTPSVETRTDEIHATPRELEAIGRKPGAWLSLEQLEEIEWTRATKRCLVCMGKAEEGHADWCWLAAKIREARGEHE